MISKITCFVVILLVCLTIPVFAQTEGGSGKTASLGVMFDSSGVAGPYLNFDSTVSSQDAFDLSASAGLAFFSVEGISLALVPIMLNVKSKPTGSGNLCVGGGAGMIFAGASYEGQSGSGMIFGYQFFVRNNFSPKMFGELKMLGISGGMLLAISGGMNF